MSVRYRRGRPTRGDSVAAAVASVAIGAGVACGAFYLMRLFLARESLEIATTPRGTGAGGKKIGGLVADTKQRARKQGEESNGGPTS